MGRHSPILAYYRHSIYIELHNILSYTSVDSIDDSISKNCKSIFLPILPIVSSKLQTSRGPCSPKLREENRPEKPCKLQCTLHSDCNYQAVSPFFLSFFFSNYDNSLDSQG